MHNSIEQAFTDLLQWCREREFAGYDPFDALNSRVLNATPLRHSRTARLISTQIVKRSPVNLRPWLLVPQQKNAKGLALFALSALSNHRRLKTSVTEEQARSLLAQLLEMQISGYHGAAWGYNFDWQSRNFYAPQGTPMIVPTAFAARAFIEGYETLKDPSYLQTALSVGDFILKDLNRTVDSDDELCFSYSPIDQTRIFNASLFAVETLARLSRFTQSEEFCALAQRAARYVANKQRDDGS
ncbi:MAG TPA: hypothetical protein VGW36_06705, partial [Pyrinomonadaceae bacterium]|nr:hypothetical protein [Pyrinomonadaceae bacterium]